MTTHTQGPWVATCTGPEAFVIHPEHHTVWVVAKTYKQEDARLIAAAPDLLKALNSLRSSAYWIVEGGEFAHWVNDKTMPLAAAKELAELAEMVRAAQSLIDKATGETK